MVPAKVEGSAWVAEGQAAGRVSLGGAGLGTLLEFARNWIACSAISTPFLFDYIERRCDVNGPMIGLYPRLTHSNR